MANYSLAYWVAIVLAFAFLIVDIFSDSAVWNAVVIVCIGAAIFLRPGGVRGKAAS